MYAISYWDIHPGQHDLALAVALIAVVGGLSYAAWHSRKHMEPVHLIQIGIGGAFIFAAIALIGVIWQQNYTPKNATPSATYNARGGDGGGGAAAGPGAIATGGGNSGIMNPETLFRLRTHDDGSMEFYQVGQNPDAQRQTPKP